MGNKKRHDSHAKHRAKAPASPPAKTGVPPLPAGSGLCAKDGARRARVTRAKAATMLECSVASVRRLEQSGTLHPAVDAATGERSFDIAELQRVAAERSGKDATALPPLQTNGDVSATIFELLEAGRSLADIVMQLRVPPEAAERTALAWMRLKQLDLNAPSVPGTVAKLIRTVNLLVEQMRQLQAACSSCPLAGIGTRECEGCGSAGMVAVTVECTDCGCRFRRGFWPQTEDEDEQ